MVVVVAEGGDDSVASTTLMEYAAAASDAAEAEEVKLVMVCFCFVVDAIVDVADFGVFVVVVAFFGVTTDTS